MKSDNENKKDNYIKITINNQQMQHWTLGQNMKKIVSMKLVN